MTVTGAGGSGKSRVAVAVAEKMRERFANGVAFVELAPLEDPGLVVGAIAQQLGVAERGDEDLLQTLSRWLAPRELLVILDNLERLVDAGPSLVQLLRAGADADHPRDEQADPAPVGRARLPAPAPADRRRGAAVRDARARARPERSIPRTPRGGAGTRDLPPRGLPAARGRARGHPGRHARRREPARTSERARRPPRRRSARPARTAADPPRHARLEHRPPLAGGAHAVRAAGRLLRRLHRRRRAGRRPAEQPNRSPPSSTHSLLRVSGESGELRFSMLETVRDHAARAARSLGCSRRGAERARRTTSRADRAHRAPRRADQHAAPADRPRHRQLPRRDGLVRAQRAGRRSVAARDGPLPLLVPARAAARGAESPRRSARPRRGRPGAPRPGPARPGRSRPRVRRHRAAPRSGHARESRPGPRPGRWSR